MMNTSRIGSAADPLRDTGTTTTVNTETQNQKAARFRTLHQNPQTFVLPNAWDAASARIFEAAGFPAVGTSSAGLAHTLGYPDGQKAPREEVLFMARRIAATVAIPLTVDAEAGYGVDSVKEVALTAEGIIAAGGIGMNLEDMAFEADQLVDAELQTDKIRAVRARGDELDVPIVINARTDAFHLAHLPVEERFALAVARANAYYEAGADCLFVPFVTDAGIIKQLAAEIAGPINILATVGSPTVGELSALGVRRISLGSGPCRAAMARARKLAIEIRDHGTYHAMLDDTIPYPEMNALFIRS
jgi:2-methylisocitrate lyase-like PEP mutase family enzyme